MHCIEYVLYTVYTFSRLQLNWVRGVGTSVAARRLDDAEIIAHAVLLLARIAEHPSAEEGAIGS